MCQIPIKITLLIDTNHVWFVVHSTKVLCHSSFKEGFDDRKCIPKSTSHGSFGVHTKYTRHSYTPNLSRSPQHFHRPGEKSTQKSKRSQSSYHLRKDMNLPLLTSASLFYHLPLSPLPPQLLLPLLSWNNKQDWCFLPLYSLTTKTHAPLPLYVTTFSLTPKVRTPALLHPFSASLPPSSGIALPAVTFYIS